MSSIDTLLRNYARFVQIPWDENLAGAQKVWFVIYDPPQERRLRRRLDEFAIATTNAGHGWRHLDLTDAFARWMAAHAYREAYFQSPRRMRLALADFGEEVARLVREALTADDVDADTVVALSGVGALYGMLKTSDLVNAVSDVVRGRLLVFFPGELVGANYRLFDARDGFNYHAVAITASEGV